VFEGINVKRMFGKVGSVSAEKDRVEVEKEIKVDKESFLGRVDGIHGNLGSDKLKGVFVIDA